MATHVPTRWDQNKSEWVPIGPLTWPEWEPPTEERKQMIIHYVEGVNVRESKTQNIEVPTASAQLDAFDLCGIINAQQGNGIFLRFQVGDNMIYMNTDYIVKITEDSAVE